MIVLKLKKYKEKLKKKLKKDDVFKLIELVLKVVELFVVSSIVFNFTNVQDSYNRILTTIENNELITNNYNDAIINEELKMETLLKAAQSAYDSKDYEKVVEIYAMEKLQDNPLVNNNLGYMYANGIYYDVDLMKADYYFDKAIEVGNYKAFYNKIAAHFRLKQGNLIGLLIAGYETEGHDTIVEFISYQFEDYNDFSEEKKEEVAEWFLYDLWEERQNELIEKFYYWEYVGEVYLSYSPTNTDLVRYIKFTEHSGYADGVAYTVKGYQKEIRKCRGIDELEQWQIYN